MAVLSPAEVSLRCEPCDLPYRYEHTRRGWRWLRPIGCAHELEDSTIVDGDGNTLTMQVVR